MRGFLGTLLHGPFGPWLWILGPVFLAAAPHFAQNPAWIGTVCMGMWGWRLYGEKQPRVLPSRTIRVALTLGCIAAVYLSFGYLLGPEPGTALLLLLLALKPFETHGRRDQVLTLFMAYILVLLQFLTSQSLLVAASMIPVVLVVTAALIGLNHPSSTARPAFRLRIAGTLLLQALPVMLILFVLFPRLPGSLWGLFQRPQIGLTGLSESISPGDISELLQSSEAAFRVAFEGSSPAISRMYWRVLVLWETDGRSWRVGPLEREPEPRLARPRGDPVEYLLTLEAHGRRWLPALEMPAGASLNNPDVLPAPDFRLEVRDELRQRAQYRLGAALDFETPRPARQELRRALELPPAGNERARTLAQEWARTEPDHRGIVSQALELFASGTFVYTLRPPLLGEQAVDEFLFRTRSGYCEHYASAFTFLMRAAGVPARVVVGYQGGDRNPLGDYYVIRQYHAHAWSEVWLEEAGWLRVDPTTVLAPERIDLGAGALVPNIDLPRMLSSRELGWLITAWRGLTQGWDAANTLWNQWILDFGFERQNRFLVLLGLAGTSGLERFGRLTLALSLSVFGAALIYALTLLRSRPSADHLDSAYARFCQRLARIGLSRAPQEGPWDYARRASRQRPDLQGPITAISSLYIRLRYGPETDPEKQDQRLALREMNRLIRGFRPKPG